MDRLAHGVISAERERNIAYTAAHPAMGQMLFDPSRRFDKRDRVFRMLFNAGADRQNVRIENDILRRKSDFFRKDPISAGTDLDFASDRVRLAGLVKCHYHHRGAIPADSLGLAPKLLFSFFEADRVYYPFSLDRLEPSFENTPFGTINH